MLTGTCSEAACSKLELQQAASSGGGGGASSSNSSGGGASSGGSSSSSSSSSSSNGVSRRVWTPTGQRSSLNTKLGKQLRSLHNKERSMQYEMLVLFSCSAAAVVL
jgi:hypothetical protein